MINFSNLILKVINNDNYLYNLSFDQNYVINKKLNYIDDIKEVKEKINKKKILLMI